MADQLEDFIRNNREAFDSRQPHDKVWADIERGLPARQVSLWSRVGIWRAAAVIFMALSAYLLMDRIPVGKPRTSELVLQEFRDVEEFYISQIAQKESLIDDLKDTDGLNGFTMDFKQLEAMYSVLKEEMKVRPSQKVKDALILNLLVRIDLLNQQLHKLEQQEEGGAESTETDTGEATI